MAAYILSNALVYLKDILPITSGVWATFRISPDLERGLNIETGAVNAFFVLKSSTQIERFLITATGWVATIVKRGLEQDGITENANLKKSWGDGSVGYITVKPDDFITLGKLDTSWGLRNTMGTAQNIGATNGSANITVADTTWWANGATITGTGIPWGTTIVSFVPNTSAVLSANFTGTTGTVSVIIWKRMSLEIDSSNNEVKKPIWVWSSILSTETFRKLKADWTYEDIPYSFIENSITQWNSQDNIAGEALTANDAVLYEYLHTSLGAAISGIGKSLTQEMGDVSWNTRVSMGIIGNWISTSNIVLWLWKTWAPTDNMVIRIETDDWTGKPSGTLAHANATANIAGTWLTISPVNTTVTFGGAFSLTNGTIYHIVAQRQNAVDGSNYYNIAAVTKNVRFFKRNLYNGTVWWTASSTVSLHVQFIGAYRRVLVKSVANITELASFDGFVTTTASVWASTKINIEGIMSWFSGLTIGEPYYISNTAWVISLSPWTTMREVWYAVSASKLYIKNPLFNPSNYEFVVENPVSVINESSSVNGAHTSYSCRAIAKWRIWFWINSANSNTLNVFINNTTARTITWTSIPVVFHDIYPWDIITANFSYGWSWFYWRIVQFQQLLAPITRSE